MPPPPPGYRYAEAWTGGLTPRPPSFTRNESVYLLHRCSLWNASVQRGGGRAFGVIGALQHVACGPLPRFCCHAERMGLNNSTLF